MSNLIRRLRSQEAVDARPHEIEKLTDEAANLIEQQARDIEALKSDIEDQIQLTCEAMELAVACQKDAALFRSLLANMADEFVRVYPIYYYAEPWAHDRNAVLKVARAALAEKDPT